MIVYVISNEARWSLPRTPRFRISSPYYFSASPQRSLRLPQPCRGGSLPCGQREAALLEPAICRN